MTELNCYFAYGSNLSRERLRARVPEAVAMGAARLPHWTLCFDKHGRDGSAKASIRRAVGQEVWGAVYRMMCEAARNGSEGEGLGATDSRVRRHTFDQDSTIYAGRAIPETPELGSVA